MRRVFTVFPLILFAHLFSGNEPALAQPGVS